HGLEGNSFALPGQNRQQIGSTAWAVNRVKIDGMPRSAVALIAQGQGHRVALAHPDHRSGYLAVEGHVGKIRARLDLGVHLMRLESYLMIDWMVPSRDRRRDMRR